MMPCLLLFQALLIGVPQDALEKRVFELVEQLKTESIDERAKALDGLRRLGKAAVPALKKASKDSNPEVAARIRDLLDEFGFIRLTRSDKGISLSCRDGDIRKVILKIAEAGKGSVVIAPVVRGFVTAEFSAVSWEKALERVLKPLGFRSQAHGPGFLYILGEEFRPKDRPGEKIPAVTVSLREMRVTEILDTHARITGMSLVYSPHLDEKMTLEADIEKENEVAILESIAKKSGTVAVRDASGIFRILTPREVMWEKKWSAKLEAARPKAKAPERKRVTFNFRNAEVGVIFDMVRRVCGVKLSVDPDVEGFVSLSVNDMPGARVLDLVARLHGYGAVEHESGVVRIARPEKLVSGDKED